MPTLKQIVKPFFETGDFPTQAQFEAVFDGVRWNDETIPVSSVEGLVDILNTLPRPKQTLQLSAPGSVIVPADCEVYKITFKSSVATQTISYGITTAGDDIEPGIVVTAGTTARSEQAFEVVAGGSIHFGGITGLTNIVIYKD